MFVLCAKKTTGAQKNYRDDCNLQYALAKLLFESTEMSTVNTRTSRLCESAYEPAEQVSEMHGMSTARKQTAFRLCEFVYDAQTSI